MRKLFYPFLLVMLVCTMNTIQAQDDAAKTLFGNGNGNGSGISKEDIGFFVAPAYSLSQIDGAAASMFHLRGGINLKDRFTFGGFYNVSLNQIIPESETIGGIYLDYWSTGGFAEYTVLSKKLVHVTVPIQFGYGEVQMDNEDDDANFGESNFFVFEPALMLEVNLHKYVRFNVGTGYRMLSEMTYRNFNQNDVNGLTAYAGLKFGVFK